MKSPIEHIVCGFNWSALGRAKRLKSGLFFLLLAFVAIRLGAHIPLPGVDTASGASSPFAHMGSLFY